MEDFTKEGWAAAPDYAERVYEAAQFFNTKRNGSPVAQATLTEAFSTPDFPVLLGNAFEKQAIAAQKAAVNEFDGIAAHATRPDFTRGQLVDLFSGDAFERVGEGEEYKGGTLTETGLEHGTAKWGRNYTLTFELRMRRLFSDLAKFPVLLGNGAVKAKNNAVADLLVDGGDWNTDLFGAVETQPLDADGLTAAFAALGQREDHRGDLVDTTNLVLVVGPALQIQANQLVNADRLVVKQTSGSGKETRTEAPNPFKGLVSVVVSRTVGQRLGTNQSTRWALVQGAGSSLPSIIDTGLEGHDGNVDIRVKRDQGESVSGGAISPDEGSFKDDTIAYRGRTFFGIDKGFGAGVYAAKTQA